MSTTITRPLTADELLAMPDDGWRYELVKGELIRMSPAADEHGQVTMNVAGPLFSYVKTNHLGVVYAADTGFKLESNPDTVRAPDVAFMSNERLKLADKPRSFREGAPDLVVEVLSPSDRMTKVEAKVAQWLGTGALMVWVVNPKRRTVAVYRSETEIVVLTEKDTLDGADVVAGFQIAVADLFQSR